MIGTTVTANGTTASVKKIKFLLDNFNSSDIIGTVERLNPSDQLNSQVKTFLAVLLDKTSKA